jgi:hypothetical protein
MSKYLLRSVFLFFSLCHLSSYSQVDPGTIWRYIDTNIAKKNNLSDLNSLLQQLKQKTIADKNYFQTAHCYFYQLLISDQRTEDSFYFRNSAFIDSLLMVPSTPAELQMPLHLVMAKRISSFTFRGLRFNRQRYERTDIPFNYAGYSDEQLDSIVQSHFEQAKAFTKQNFLIPIDDALWLSSNPLLFLFKPDLFDIAIAEQISYSAKGNFIPFRLQLKQRQWLSLLPDQFINAIDSVSSLKEKDFQAIRLYQEWLDYHKNNPATYYFIETLARKYLAGSGFDDDSASGKLYENYLKSYITSPFTIVRAHAVCQLCLFWNSEGQKYFPGNRRYDYDESNSEFDTSKRFKIVDALELFQQNDNMLDSFSYLKDILSEIKRRALEGILRVKMEQYNLPAEPILAELVYKNTPSLHYRIVSVPQGFVTDMNKGQLLKKLLLRKIVDEKKLSLPLPPDHNFHASYIRIGPLPAGSYFMIISDSVIKDPGAKMSFVSFDVTSITTLNNDKRLYILDRKTGFPLAGAKVEGNFKKTVKVDTGTVIKTVARKYIANKEGYVNINDGGPGWLKIVNGSDTIMSYFDSHGKNVNPSDDIYDKEEYDGLVDYYEENARVHIFTDRSIYRRGQTVYYKALFLTKDPKTGETIVMNEQNLKGFLFKNFLKKWRKEESPLLYLTDPFGKEIDSVKINPNEFGSQAGSFIIPKSAATGEWNVEPDYVETDDANNGEFSVEEYKRPTFDVVIETSKELLRPGDAFSFKVKVKSFAGANLNDVKIDYTLVRNGFLPLFDSISQKIERRFREETLANTSGFTNADGELEITVKDSLLKTFSLEEEFKWDFNYNLEANVIDETGESYVGNADLRVSSRPVRLNVPLEKMYDRKELKVISVEALDKNSQKISRDVSLKIYKLPTRAKLYSDRKLQRADQWIYPVDELEKDFPTLEFRTENTVTKKLVFEKEINTGKLTYIALPAESLDAGNYEIEAVCEEDGKITGDASRNFSVFDSGLNELPDPGFAFYHAQANFASPGSKINFYSGNAEKDFYSIYQLIYYSRKKSHAKYYYENLKQNKGINKWALNVPGDARDQMTLVQVYVINNNIYEHEERIFVDDPGPDKPEIIFEQYRKRPIPGEKETFIVSVKTKNENTAAELLTTMYDASLDKLEGHHWTVPYDNSYRSLNTEWQRSINDVTNNGYENYYDDEYQFRADFHKRPLWWVDSLRYGGVIEDRDIYDFAPGSGNFLQGRAAGLTIVNTQGLNEVVVAGFGVQRKRELTGSSSVIRIRGSNSLIDYRQPLVILDGVPFTGDLNSIDTKGITDILVLRGADAASIYGAQASNGVLVLSTKGEIKLPEEPEPVVTIRKNFSETAFFFPRVHTDKEGYYKFSFIMPESVSEWNWKLFAHTKKAQFAYAERKLNTQLPLMVQPDVPRLLYQGDSIVLESRISNLDSVGINGKVVCKIEDAVTGEDITASMVLRKENNFSVNKKANIYSAFEIKVPENQLNPLKILIEINSKDFSDGEEHIIPILSPQILVRKNVPFAPSPNRDTVIRAIDLNGDDKLYGVGISIMPNPQSALINALPYLANYSYNCSEQTFNKLLAHVTAFYIMRNDRQAQESFGRAKQAVEKQQEPKEQLPDELSEQAMPWLDLSNWAQKRQRQLFELLDTSRAEEKIRNYLEKLYKLQNADGGMAWFDGGNSDAYISSYVLAGFGRLKNSKLLIPEKIFDSRYITFVEKLEGYCNEQFRRKNKETRADLLFYCYSISFWKDANSLRDSSLNEIRKIIREQWADAGNYDLYKQALLVITTVRYFEKKDGEYQRAIQQLNSIEQLAIKDEVNGIRWKSLADADDMSNTGEETLSVIIDAFTEANIHSELFPGVTKWLLTARSDDHWSSTKGTSAAIAMLLKQNNTAIGTLRTISATINDSNISVTDDLLNGSPFAFIKNDKPLSVEIKKQNGISGSGTVIWYYFNSYDKLKPSNDGVRLQKELFRYDRISAQWERVTEKTFLRVADKIKVVLIVETPKALRYVYIDDKRSAAFEPADIHSGYQYQQGISHYTSVRDTGVQFFAEFIPSGRSTIDYEMVVAHEGNFMNGPALLQCMYRPEVSAYSNSQRVQTAN